MKDNAYSRGFRAELWDQIQYFLETTHDHQIRATIHFYGFIDQNCLAQAVNTTLDMIPILQCRYVERFTRPYWKNDPRGREQAFAFYQDQSGPEEWERFLTQNINPMESRQVRVGLFRSASDTLCVVINHMIADAAGFKDFLYLLAHNYNRLLRDPAYVLQADQRIIGSRGLDQVKSQLRLPEFLKILWLDFGHQQNAPGQAYFQVNDRPAPGIPRIDSFRIDGEAYNALISYGKKYGATINDVLLAACYKVFYDLLGFDNGEITIGMTVDLRRYLPGRKAEAICNLLSVVITRVELAPGDSLGDVLIKVRQLTRRYKQNYIGLTGYTKYMAGLNIFPYAARKRAFNRYFCQPRIVFSNLAALGPERLKFGPTPVVDANMSGSVKYPPYCQLAVSSFGRSLTFSFNYCDTNGQSELTERFMTLLKEQLLTAIPPQEPPVRIN